MSWARRCVLLLATSLVGCSSAGESNEQRSAEPIDAKLAADPSVAVADAPGPAQPAVIEIDVGGSALDASTVPIAPVAPEPASVTWTERARFDEALDFVFVTGGVVARSPSGLRELDADTGELVARPELALPEADAGAGEAELLGYWPDSVWHVLVEPMSPEEAGTDEPRFYYQVSTLRRGAWAIERRRGAKRWRDGAIQFRKGWHGGLLLRNGASISRVGSSRAKPHAGARKGKEIVDIFETRAGRLYTITERDADYWVQANCDDLDCVEANAKRLPRGRSWRFSMQSPRRSNDGSMLATSSSSDRDLHYLLSYDDHTWELEALVEAPAGMWPDDAGGLWVLIAGELWRRARDGSWTTIELPGAGASISAAMTVDRSQLWLARGDAGATTVFVTPGTPD